MNKKVAIGIQSYEDLIKNNCFYVDKTGFIKEWWDSMDSVTLITRPRRFGKTLNMSMLECFFSLDYADRRDLFEGLSIWQDDEYRQVQGTYPVISLSFARIKERDYSTARDKICEIIRCVYSKFDFLRESDALTDVDKKFFERVMDVNITDSDLTSSLHQLSCFLQKYYQKKVIILLDEYDTPMQEAYVNGFWEDIVALTRSLFNSTFKTNPYLERAIMTGITRVSKESIFSDLNHLEVVTTTSNKYATAFGFTEEEVFTALDECGIGEKKCEVKNWYDGFIFGEYSDIYNPWSVINYIDKKKFSTYWANTSSNSLVGMLIREGNSDIKESFSSLIRGETIFCKIDEQIVYNQLDNDESAIWSLLVASGYLKVIGYEQIELIDEFDEVTYELAITNREVRHMFINMINGWFKSVKREYNGFVSALLRNDLEEMNIYMTRVTCETFSYFDTGKGSFGPEPERFYHGFVLGLLTELNKEYVLTSNRESGFGRYDVMIEPRDKDKNAYILEFKVFNKNKEASLEDTVTNALKQIEEKQYESELVARGVDKSKIYKYGFAFEGKNVLIGEQS